MASIDTLPDLLSLDITAGLVAQGIRAPWRGGAALGDSPIFTINVLDASNTSPIVITVPPNSLTADDQTVGVRPGKILHVVISGVTGNTAANKQNQKSLRFEAWHAVVTSPTTLALFELDNSTGAPVASVGNGAYAGGGTITKALVEARVLLGVEEVKSLLAAPRIVMVPAGVQHGAREIASSWDGQARADGEPTRERLAPTLTMVRYWYDVHVWGKDFTPDQEVGRRSLGVTEKMHKQVLRSAHVRCAGSYETRDGVWPSQKEGAVERMKHGQDLVFGLGFGTPVPREAPTTATLTPSDVVTLVDLSMTINGGPPEEA